MTDQIGGYDKGQWWAAAGILAIGIPVALFYVSCSKSEPAAPSVPYEAIKICQDQLKERASHPSTVKFSMLSQSTDFGAPGGGYRVALGFDAKNSFGMEIKHQGICHFAPDSLQVVNVMAAEK